MMTAGSSGSVVPAVITDTAQSLKPALKGFIIPKTFSKVSVKCTSVKCMIHEVSGFEQYLKSSQFERC